MDDRRYVEFKFRGFCGTGFLRPDMSGDEVQIEDCRLWKEDWSRLTGPGRVEASTRDVHGLVAARGCLEVLDVVGKWWWRMDRAYLRSCDYRVEEPKLPRWKMNLSFRMEPVRAREDVVGKREWTVLDHREENDKLLKRIQELEAKLFHAERGRDWVIEDRNSLLRQTRNMAARIEELETDRSRLALQVENLQKVWIRAWQSRDEVNEALNKEWGKAAKLRWMLWRARRELPSDLKKEVDQVLEDTR